MDKIQQVNKRYYDKNAEVWSVQRSDAFYQEKQFRKFVEYFEPGDSVVDIGCGYGIHAPLFLGLGYRLKYYGFDISAGMLKLARSRYPQLVFDQTDILDRCALPKKKFDGFWAAAVFMHIPKVQWEELLTNVEFMMKKGAIGYITLPEKRPNPEAEYDHRYFSLFKKGEFNKIAVARGWRVVRSGTLLSTNKKTNWFWYIVKLPK